MKKITIVLLILFLLSPVFAIDNNKLLKQVDRNLNPES